jgi:hypothetical protein
MALDLLKNILDDEFLESLAKSADLYKIGSNSVLDPEEIRIGLKVVPRAVMAMLISELAPMEINSHKDIQLPFGKVAYIRVNKNAADDFTGSVYSDNKLVYSFMNRSIPGLGIILLSTFELYDMEEIHKPNKHAEDIDRKVQKLIDERMELHSLVGRVVEEKMAQREAIHKLMMAKLTEAMVAPTPAVATPLDIKPGDITKKETGHEKGIHRHWTSSTGSPSTTEDLNGRSTAGMYTRTVGGHPPTKEDAEDSKIRHTQVLNEMKQMPKPNLGKSEKGSPLKGFLERKKKPREHKVEMMKSETVDCPDCGQTIFGSSGFSGCICFGQDQHRKIWLKKTEDGVQLRFSRGWDEDNISQLLEMLRDKNGKH